MSGGSCSIGWGKAVLVGPGQVDLRPEAAELAWVANKGTLTLTATP